VLREIDADALWKVTVETAVFPSGYPKWCPSVMQLEIEYRYSEEMEIVEVRQGQCLRCPGEVGGDEVDKSQETNMRISGNDNSVAPFPMLDDSKQIVSIRPGQ
jgi:hypothetical protein